jgi:1-deoxy-D-xylulose-5-phosphate synthase
MVVMAPKDENELCRMLVTALTHNGPSALRYPRGQAQGVVVDPTPLPLPLGSAEILENGDDVVIIAIGRTVGDAMDAHRMLKAMGIHATVINARFVKPLDAEQIGGAVRRIPRIVTVEENVRQGGFGSAVLECLCDQGVAGFRIERIGLPDVFIEHGSQAVLRTKYGISAQAIVDAAQRLMSRQD